MKNECFTGFLAFLLLAVVMSFSNGVYAQQKTIGGKITDTGNNPLPGVSISVKGTTIGIVTNVDGYYELSVPENAAILLFSYIGMKTQEIVIGTQTTIDVVLEEDLVGLEEVVVVGYGTQKKVLTTGANLNVKGEDIAALNTGSAMEALQGVAAGVSITRNNGAPGAGTRVTIRGLGTIGNSNPLYIVDGIAVGNIDYLNASDIESIDVLKDAASAAIYGSRAANGVVLVTTVKGSKSRPAQITYDGYYGVQNIYKNLDPLTAQEYMYIMDEGRVNDGLAPNNWEAMIKNNNWLNNNYTGLGTQLGEDVWDALQNGWEGTNWIDEMTAKDAPIQSHALNITGGSQDITYSMGVSYFDQKSIIGGDLTDAGYKRLTARLNTQMVLKKNQKHSILTVGENMTYTNSENRSARTGNIYWNDLHNALTQHPLMPAYWQPAIDNNINQFGFTPTMDGINQHTNPLASMYYATNYNYGKGSRFVGSVFGELEPIQNLKLRSSYGIDGWFGHNRSMNPTYALGTLYTDDVDGAQQSQYLGSNWTWTTTVSYEYQINDHRINALVGYELLQNQINNEVGGSRTNLLFPGDPEYAYINNTKSPASISDINTWGADWAAGGGGIMSYIARAQYNYKEKYLASATFRADGSSNFAKDNRWGYFPSISAGWLITSEDFMQDYSNIINFGKIRASWGQNGNQSIDNFIYSSQIAYVFPGYFFGDTKPVSGTTAYPAKVPNPDVTWETSEQLNIGFDARLLDSKLAVTFDWYKKTTKDWLLEAPILGTSGAGAPFINGGDIENKGVEMVFSWNDNIRDFKYGVTLSGAYNKNEVTRIANTDGIIHGPSHVLSQGTSEVSRVEVGYPIGYFYGFKTDGILQNQDEVDAYLTPEGNPYFNDQRPGDVRFVDQNQDGKIDEEDKVYLGNPNPDFEMGLQINLEYKSFYLNTTLVGKYGMQVMQSYRSFSDNFTQNYTSSVFDRWHGEGTSTKMPRLTYGSNRNQQYISDIYMHNADYLRVNNLTFGYDFTKLVTTKVDAISALKMYVAVNNLYTFTKYDGMDPEVRFGHDAGWASGIDLGLYPLPRTVMFGLSLGF